MLEVLANSCNNALAIGLHYRFDPPTSNGVSDVEIAPAQTILKFFDPTNMMQKYNGDWQPGGFPDGDVLCADADWVTSYQNTKAKSPKGLNALFFASNVAKLSEGEYSFAIHRGSPEMRAFTYLVTDGLATEVDVPIGDTDVYRYVLQYGVSADDQALIKKLNEASN